MLIDSRVIRAVAGVALAGLAIAACTTTANGSPTVPPASDQSTDSPPGSEPASQDPTYGAPRVDDPLNANPFLPRPCDVLSQAQLESLGVTRPGVPSTTGAIAETVGPSCLWFVDTEITSSIGIGFNPGNKNGLSDNYRAREELDYFEPTTVEGYPAVFTEGFDRRETGGCGIVVGITDTLTFSATETGDLTAPEACDRAKQVAAAAVTTIRGNG